MACPSDFEVTILLSVVREVLLSVTPSQAPEVSYWRGPVSACLRRKIFIDGLLIIGVNWIKIIPQG